MSQATEIGIDLRGTGPPDGGALQRPAPAPLAIRPKRQVRQGLKAAFAQALDERCLFVLLPFCVIAGLIVSVEVSSAPQPWVLVAGSVVLALLVAVSTHALTTLRFATAAMAFWLGFSLLAIHGALYGTLMLSQPAYGTFQARVDEIISKTGPQQRIVVSGIRPMAETKGLDVRRARVFVRAGPDLEPGDVIETRFRFYPVPGPAVPGAFDAQFHSYFDGIGAYATTNAAPVIISEGAAAQPDRVIETLRGGISARLDAVLAEPAAGIARAVINGDQSAVTEEARDIMATAGLAHVLSISGLHLTLVAGGVYFALRLLLAALGGGAGRFSAKRLAAIGGMVSALLYFSISGGNVAAMRSTIMILLVFGAMLAGRRALTMRNVAVAGLLVIVTDPASVFRPSFQLSFAAVIALVGTYESYRPRRDREHSTMRKLAAYFFGIAVTSLVAGAATVLFSVYHFQQTSPLGVVGNLISLPLVGFVMMPAALLGVLAMPLGLEWLPITIMGWSIDWMLQCAAVIASYSRHISASPLLTPLSLVLGLLALAWFAFFKSPWRVAGPAAALLAVPLLTLDNPPDVLVADTTQAVAIRQEGGMGLASGKANSFAVGIWKETYSEPIEKLSGGLSCDALGCIAQGKGGFTVAVVRDPAAFGEDCRVADLVVTRLMAPNYCRAATTVLDATDLRRGGVQWLRWLGGSFEIRPAITGLNRPWRVAPP